MDAALKSNDSATDLLCLHFTCSLPLLLKCLDVCGLLSPYVATRS